MFDITKIIEAVIALVGLCITSFLIPYLKSKTSKETQEEVNKWIRIAVSAAEQIYAGEGRGKEKKEYVVNWLKDHKIKYDYAKIDAMIESAVYDLKNNGVFLAEPLKPIDETKG